MSGNDKDREDGEQVIIAAEYVLGLLSPEEERRAQEMARHDPTVEAEVERWQRHFARLAEDLTPVPPPRHVWQNIRKAMSAGGGVPRTSLWDNTAFWRGLSFASLGAATAAAIAGIVAFAQLQDPAITQSRLVAALAAAGGQAAFVATYDPLRKQLVIVPASVTKEPGRVPELWLVTRDKRVISLGLVDGEHARAVFVPRDLVAETGAGAGLVVTLEPPGGAPGGVATGPAIAKGELSPI